MWSSLVLLFTALSLLTSPTPFFISASTSLSSSRLTTTTLQNTQISFNSLISLKEHIRLFNSKSLSKFVVSVTRSPSDLISISFKRVIDTFTTEDLVDILREGRDEMILFFIKDALRYFLKDWNHIKLEQVPEEILHLFPIEYLSRSIFLQLNRDAGLNCLISRARLGLIRDVFSLLLILPQDIWRIQKFRENPHLRRLFSPLNLPPIKQFAYDRISSSQSHDDGGELSHLFAYPMSAALEFILSTDSFDQIFSNYDPIDPYHYSSIYEQVRFYIFSIQSLLHVMNLEKLYNEQLLKLIIEKYQNLRVALSNRFNAYNNISKEEKKLCQTILEQSNQRCFSASILLEKNMSMTSSSSSTNSWQFFKTFFKTKDRNEYLIKPSNMEHMINFLLPDSSSSSSDRSTHFFSTLAQILIIGSRNHHPEACILDLLSELTLEDFFQNGTLKSNDHLINCIKNNPNMFSPLFKSSLLLTDLVSEAVITTEISNFSKNAFVLTRTRDYILHESDLIKSVLKASQSRSQPVISGEIKRLNSGGSSLDDIFRPYSPSPLKSALRSNLMASPIPMSRAVSFTAEQYTLNLENYTPLEFEFLKRKSSYVLPEIHCRVPDLSLNSNYDINAEGKDKPAPQTHHETEFIYLDYAIQMKKKKHRIPKTTNTTNSSSFVIKPSPFEVKFSAAFDPRIKPGFMYPRANDFHPVASTSNVTMNKFAKKLYSEHVSIRDPISNDSNLTTITTSTPTNDIETPLEFQYVYEVMKALGSAFTFPAADFIVHIGDSTVSGNGLRTETFSKFGTLLSQPRFQTVEYSDQLDGFVPVPFLCPRIMAFLGIWTALCIKYAVPLSFMFATEFNEFLYFSSIDDSAMIDNFIDKAYSDLFVRIKNRFTYQEHEDGFPDLPVVFETHRMFDLPAPYASEASPFIIDSAYLKKVKKSNDFYLAVDVETYLSVLKSQIRRNLFEGRFEFQRHFRSLIASEYHSFLSYNFVKRLLGDDILNSEDILKRIICLNEPNSITIYDDFEMVDSSSSKTITRTRKEIDPAALMDIFIRRMTVEQCNRFLWFVTGSSRTPLENLLIRFKAEEATAAKPFSKPSVCSSFFTLRIHNRSARETFDKFIYALFMASGFVHSEF